LRLRGGGGSFKITIVNVATKEEHEIKSVDQNVTFDNMIAHIAKKLECKADRLIITKVDDKTVEFYATNERIQEYLGENKYPATVKITYGMGLDFKEIVKCFQANGIMS